MTLSKSNLYVLLVLFSIANLYPLWLLDYFPSVDGPAHVALTHIWLNYENEGYAIYREFFEKSSINSPNMLVYFLLYCLMMVFPPFIAEKLLLSLFVVGLPISVWYMTTSYNYKGGVVALLSFPLVYNYITYFGFYNFLFGSLVYCITMGYWLRYRGKRSWSTPVFTALLLLGAYYTHLSSVIFLILSISILLIFEIVQIYVLSTSSAPSLSEVQTISLKEQTALFILASLPVSVLLAIYFLTVY